ncbi:MAG TPA: MFS transporter [Solirubrobacteraceae bacterium]|nr:MFS transporter [Solirubrobacteraceae bacterium]
MGNGGWKILAVLAAAQFLMVLDQAVMNVSISQLVEDFDTEVTTIQAVITLYSLVMAALMIAGGKIGDLWGRRRAFAVGHAIYGVGSLVTAFAWSVPVLTLGWSVLEGIGAALVLPALAALTARSFQGRDRALAYGVLGGVSGAGIAVGPILGGWVTTNLTWRVVFAGEVVVVALILLGYRRMPSDRGRPGAQLDLVGAVLSAVGLAAIVLAVLNASSWGWLQPRNSPIEPFGFSLTPFLIAGGAGVLALFRIWQRRREAQQREPLIHLALLRIAALRGGLVMFMFQNLILMGIFFAVPLYLQIVQGFDAFETGLRMLPVSVTLFVTALLGSRLSRRLSPRLLVRAGTILLVLASLLLLATIEPEIDTLPFGIAMAVLGIGMGLIVSQLGNVVQSAVGEGERSEAGGLQYTAQQLGASLGTALIGAVVISGLIASFSSNVTGNPQISAAVQEEVSVRLAGDVSFVSTAHVRSAAEAAGVDAATTDALVADYADSQLKALKTGLLVAALLSFAAFLSTGNLPTRAGPAAAEVSDSELVAA